MWFGSGDRRQLISNNGSESNECRSTGVFGSLRFRRSPEEQPPPAYASGENFKANGDERVRKPSKQLDAKRGDIRKYGIAETAMSSKLLLPRDDADDIPHHAGKEVMPSHQCQLAEKAGHVRDNHLGQQESLFAPKASRACSTPTGSVNHDRDCLLKKSRWRKSKKSQNGPPAHHKCGSRGLNNPSFDDSLDGCMDDSRSGFS